MLGFFFRCIACQTGFHLKVDKTSFPLCRICSGNLLTCPTLCIQCGSPICPELPNQICSRPWAYRESIHSYSARYLLLNPTYAVLRRWKIHGGVLFDQQILKSTPPLLKTWREFQAEAIVPIPQYFQRAWQMGGSRAERIASWVGFETRLPVVHALLPPRTSEIRKRQATLTLSERSKSRIRFSTSLQEVQPLKRVILVDDFMTSGRTLDQASQTLLTAGVEQIHVFCLGLRAFRFNRGI